MARDKLLTLAEIRLKFGVSVWQVYQWAADGKILPVAREGHRIYYLEREIREMATSGRSPNPSSLWPPAIHGDLEKPVSLSA